MRIKIIYIKRKVLLLILITYSGVVFSQGKHKEEWLLLYKEYAVFHCMCEITDNKLEKDLWAKKDISFNVHGEVLGIYSDEADSLGRNFARRIKPIDFIETSDLYGFKPLYAECLHFFNSKILADKAKKSYRKFKLTQY